MDVVDPLRIIFAFGFVLGLIGLLALTLRYFAKKNPGWGLNKKDGRLQIIETKMIDTKHKLVLIKRDEQEHLLLLSPQEQHVVEMITPDKAAS